MEPRDHGLEYEEDVRPQPRLTRPCAAWRRESRRLPVNRGEITTRSGRHQTSGGSWQRQNRPRRSATKPQSDGLLGPHPRKRGAFWQPSAYFDALKRHQNSATSLKSKGFWNIQQLSANKSRAEKRAAERGIVQERARNGFKPPFFERAHYAGVVRIDDDPLFIDREDIHVEPLAAHRRDFEHPIVDRVRFGPDQNIPFFSKWQAGDWCRHIPG